MLMSMINLDRLQQTILLVVIQRDNLDRMKKADPITLESTLAGGLLPPPRYPLNLSILMAYEDDQGRGVQTGARRPDGVSEVAGERSRLHQRGRRENRIVSCPEGGQMTPEAF